MTEYKALSEYAPFNVGERFEDDDGDVLVIADGDNYIWGEINGGIRACGSKWAIHSSTAKVKPLDRAPQSNYNDNKWHGWNGGECPVHPDTLVECTELAGYISCDAASTFYWGSEEDQNPVIAFRVADPYIEPPKPREFWIDPKTMDADFSPLEAGYIKVREVIE